MKTWQKAVLVGGAALVGIGVVVLASKGGVTKTVLNLTHGANGHTDPIAGTYEFNSNDYVALTAVPDEGYQVNVWTVDGNSRGATNTLTLSMSQNHNVTVTFTTIDGQTRIPTSIRCTTAPPGITVNLKQLYSGAFRRGINKWHCKPVTDYANYNEPDEWINQLLEFEALDAYQQPCANVPIVIYTDSQDYNDGELYFSDDSHLVKVITGADGKATVSLHYTNNGISELSKKRCYYQHSNLWIVNHPDCLAEGDNYPGCGLLCTGEWTGLEYNAECPNATVYGNQYEHETIPMQHNIRAEYEANRSVATIATLICWFGLKVAPEMWVW